jgi:hypothetical protein
MRASPLLASLALLLLLAAPAEARFGKRTRTPPPAADAPHKATPPGDDEDDDDKEEDEEEHRSRDGGCHDCGGDLGVSFLFSLFTPSVHTQTHLASGRPGAVTRGYMPVSLTLGLEGLALPRAEGGGAAARLALEGERWGVAFRATGLGLAAEDGSRYTDEISLLEAHLTYALLSRDRLRLRLEAGMHQAGAPDATFVGASVAGSMELCLVGPLDLELRLQVAPFPHRVVDAQAGLAMHLGPFALHGGWRAMVLDDAGLVDNVRHVDALGGPYFGASIGF